MTHSSILQPVLVVLAVAEKPMFKMVIPSTRMKKTAQIWLYELPAVLQEEEEEAVRPVWALPLILENLQQNMAPEAVADFHGYIKEAGCEATSQMLAEQVNKVLLDSCGGTNHELLYCK